MTDTDLLIISSLDQPLLSDDENQIRVLIRERIEQSVQEKNPFVALNVIKQLVQITKLGGLSLAEALYLTKKNWHIYEMEDDFNDLVFTYSGLHQHTIDRYVQVYEKLFDEPNVPPELVDDLKQRNIKDLIPIAKALKQGYEINDNQWQEIVDAPDFNSVSKIIREDIKGKEPRKGQLSIYMHRDGTLWAYTKDYKIQIGYLDVNKEDETSIKAIERIISSAGVMKQ